jgi:hypothetical protein
LSGPISVEASSPSRNPALSRRPDAGPAARLPHQLAQCRHLVPALIKGVTWRLDTEPERRLAVELILAWSAMMPLMPTDASP